MNRRHKLVQLITERFQSSKDPQYVTNYEMAFLDGVNAVVEFINDPDWLNDDLIPTDSEV